MNPNALRLLFICTLFSPLAHAGAPICDDNAMPGLSYLSPCSETTDSQGAPVANGYIAVRSGPWNATSTWTPGIPPSSANVWIPTGITVTVSSVQSEALHHVRVEGGLSFSPNTNTGLTVQSLVLFPGASLTIGTLAQPILPRVTASITFSGAVESSDPLQLGMGLVADSAYVNIYGATKTPYAMASGTPPRAGDNYIQFDPSADLSGWQKGDVLVLPGFLPGAWAEEFETIASVSTFDNKVFLTQPLANDHSPQPIPSPLSNLPTLPLTSLLGAPQELPSTLLDFWLQSLQPTGLISPHLPVPIANLSRNVVFQTSNPNDSLPTLGRGHVMFMRTMTESPPDDVSINYAEFIDLGRTDARSPIDDTKVSWDPTSPWKVASVIHQGTNPRARYSVHFHRMGENLTDPEESVVGCSIHGKTVQDFGSLKWGIDNHLSRAVREYNVVYNVIGSGLATEDGPELGEDAYNLVIRIPGVQPPVSFDEQKARYANGDFGFKGDGFWYQGPAVNVHDNIALDVFNGGFDFYGTPLSNEVILLGNRARMFQVSNLYFTPGQTLYSPNGGTPLTAAQKMNYPSGFTVNPGWVPVDQVSIQSFYNNTVGGTSGFGFDSTYLLSSNESIVNAEPPANQAPTPSVIQNFLVYNETGRSAQGVRSDYANNYVYQNLVVLCVPPGASQQAYGTAIMQTGKTLTVRGAVVGGCSTSIMYNNEEGGDNFISDLVSASYLDYYIASGVHGRPNQGTHQIIRLSSLTPAASQTKKQTIIYHAYYMDAGMANLVDLFLALPTWSYLDPWYKACDVTLDGNPLFAIEQSPDYVPFPAALYNPKTRQCDESNPNIVGVPDVFVDANACANDPNGTTGTKTNAYLFDQYGLAVNGVSAVGAVPIPGGVGWMFTPSNPPPTPSRPVVLNIASHEPTTANYQLNLVDNKQQPIATQPPEVSLNYGWNILPVTIGNDLYSFLVKRVAPLVLSGAGSGSGWVMGPEQVDCAMYFESTSHSEVLKGNCSQGFDYQTSVTLNATANTNSTFAGWSGSCSGTGDCTLTMDSDQAVTATFNLTR